MKRPTIHTWRRLFQISIAIAFIVIPILNRSRYSYVYGNFLAFHAFGIPFADPLAILQLSVKNFYLTLDNIVGALLPLVLAFLLGTVFCSWICPFGLLSELGQSLRTKVWGKKKKAWPLSGRGFPLKMTIFVLGFIAFFIFSTTPILNQLSMPAWYARFFQYYFGQDFISLCFLFILALLGLEFVAGRRLWCKYVCPQSILIILVKQLNPKRMQVAFDAEKCICKPGYERCEAACTLRLQPKTLYEKAELECSNCADCVVACARMGQALSLRVVWAERRHRKGTTPFHLPWKKILVGFFGILILTGGGIGIYRLATGPDTEKKAVHPANSLFDNHILSWQGAAADYFEFLPDGTVVCVGGDWPVNGFKGASWETGDTPSTVRLHLHPSRPDEVVVLGLDKIAKAGTTATLRVVGPGVPEQESPVQATLLRYEPLAGSHVETATTMDATAVLTRYADEVYVLDLRVQDQQEKIRKILTEGDAITNEVMLTSVKYWLSTPQIIVSEGSAPKLPISTKLRILFHDGHEEIARFSTGRVRDRSDEEFEDPWF
jgi:ferredoxin-type protein NapH